MSRIDWPAIRAHYVEGTASDPDGDPSARNWPTLEEVAALHGVSYRAVATHSAREEWPRLREAFQAEVDQARRRAIVDKRVAQVTSIDGRGLTAADAGLALVGRKLEVITRREIERGQDAGVGVDPRELATLGLAARRWVQVKDAVVGKSGVEEEPDEAAMERELRVAEALLAARIAEHRATRAADLADAEDVPAE